MSEAGAPHRIIPWDQPLLAELKGEIDPFGGGDYFRPLDRAYNGDTGFWSVPSPEPALDDDFWDTVRDELDQPAIRAAAVTLAEAISSWEPDGGKLVFAAILRAGVPVADWLRKLLPGSAAAALSLFVGIGVDRMAVRHIRARFPDRKLVFVDGWTGRGGVAREIAQSGEGPLAVLIDPWGWADFAGCREDRFCPSACFTGPATLGFSRTFFVDPGRLFAAYRFPRRYRRDDVVRTWRSLCPAPDDPANNGPPGADGPKRFYRDTELRIHSNEVCRALINAAPETIYFRGDPAHVRDRYGLILALAEHRGLPVRYDARFLAELRTEVACSFARASA